MTASGSGAEHLADDRMSASSGSGQAEPCALDSYVPNSGHHRRDRLSFLLFLPDDDGWRRRIAVEVAVDVVVAVAIKESVG